MDEELLPGVGVECYAGYRGEQTPRTLILGETAALASASNTERASLDGRSS
jgi:hypothetical protein